jgi:hypothetical protein
VIEVRLRNRVAREEIAAREGFIPTADYYAVELVGPARVLQPDGRPLCVFLPGALRDELGQVVDQLSAIRHETRNRGAASGTRRTPAGTEERMLNPRSYARPTWTAGSLAWRSLAAARSPAGGSSFPSTASRSR